MNEIERYVDLSKIQVGVQYETELTENEMHDLADHMMLQSISKAKITYSFEENDRFHKTYDLCGRIEVSCILDDKNTEVSESFRTTLLSNNMTNISKEIIQELDIEIIEHNRVDVANIALQFLSLKLYM